MPPTPNENVSSGTSNPAFVTTPAIAPISICAAGHALHRQAGGLQRRVGDGFGVHEAGR